MATPILTIRINQTESEAMRTTPHPHDPDWDYQEPPPLKVTNLENFKLLALIPLTLLALAFAIWYFTHQEQVDSYEFEQHSRLEEIKK